MGTVLWTNILEKGKVKTDTSDKYALYKHTKKLEKLTKFLNIISFTSMHDFTDMKFNLSDEELPEGMKSTTDVMVVNGTWISGEEAVLMLETLIQYISENKIKFGLFKNDYDEVIRELEESLEQAIEAKKISGEFNYSVVM